jgi:Protein of unknown function (DUF2281)
MSTREALSEEIKNIPEALLNELYDYLLFLKYKKSEKRKDNPPIQTTSEKVLSREWDTPEEDEAWKNL